MTRTLNSYQLKDRELATAACYRLNRDPYTLTRNEAKRPLYELSYDQSDNLIKIKATYYPMSGMEFARRKKQPLKAS